MPPFDPSQFIWPLVALLAAVYFSRKVATDVRPIFINVINGVASGAKTNWMAYGIAILFGLSASLSAFIDVFKDMSHQAFASMSMHQYLALWGKVLQPFIVAILAYATQNKFKAPAPPASSVSAPPFPTPSP